MSFLLKWKFLWSYRQTLNKWWLFRKGKTYCLFCTIRKLILILKGKTFRLSCESIRVQHNSSIPFSWKMRRWNGKQRFDFQQVVKDTTREINQAIKGVLRKCDSQQELSHNRLPLKPLKHKGKRKHINKNIKKSIERFKRFLRFPEPMSNPNLSLAPWTKGFDKPTRLILVQSLDRHTQACTLTRVWSHDSAGDIDELSVLSGRLMRSMKLNS